MASPLYHGKHLLSRCICSTGTRVKSIVLRTNLHQTTSILSSRTTFSDFGLDPTLLSQLNKGKLLYPSKVQTLSIPAIIAGKDVIINSETGSGKTLAYVLPILHKMLNFRERSAELMSCPYVIVIVPNVELAFQVNAVFKYFLDPLYLETALAIPGVALRVNENTAALITTPSSLSDYKLERFSNVKTVVLDEADLLLQKKLSAKDPFYWTLDFFSNGKATKGYRKSNKRNKEYKQYPKRFNVVLSKDSRDPIEGYNMDRQFIFAGATLSASTFRSVRDLIQYWLPNVDLIQTDSTHRKLDNIKLHYVQVQNENKYKTLMSTILNLQKKVPEKLKIIVFVNGKERSEQLFIKMTTTPWITSSKSRTESSHTAVHRLMLNKEETGFDQMVKVYAEWGDKVLIMDTVEDLSAFIDSDEGILICTDTLSRGIDIPNVQAVIQYDFPNNVTDVMHRVGRTGRMGKSGIFISFVEEKDASLCDVFKKLIEEDINLEPFFSHKGSLKRSMGMVVHGLAETEKYKKPINSKT